MEIPAHLYLDKLAKINRSNKILGILQNSDLTVSCVLLNIIFFRLHNT